MAVDDWCLQFPWDERQLIADERRRIERDRRFSRTINELREKMGMAPISCPCDAVEEGIQEVASFSSPQIVEDSVKQETGVQKFEEPSQEIESSNQIGDLPETVDRKLEMHLEFEDGSQPIIDRMLEMRPKSFMTKPYRVIEDESEFVRDEPITNSDQHRINCQKDRQIQFRRFEVTSNPLHIVVETELEGVNDPVDVLIGPIEIKMRELVENSKVLVNWVEAEITHQVFDKMSSGSTKIRSSSIQSEKAQPYLGHSSTAEIDLSCPYMAIFYPGGGSDQKCLRRIQANAKKCQVGKVINRCDRSSQLLARYFNPLGLQGFFGFDPGGLIVMGDEAVLDYSGAEFRKKGENSFPFDRGKVTYLGAKDCPWATSAAV